MNTDLYLVIGLCLTVLALPAVISAFRESRPPRVAGLMVLVGAVLIAVALNGKPGGYEVQDIPGAFHRVVIRTLQ